MKFVQTAVRLKEGHLMFGIHLLLQDDFLKLTALFNWLDKMYH